jgi:hypothetical protein
LHTKRNHKKTRDLWNTRREIQIQTELDQPSRRNGQHQTAETRPQLQTSREKRSWTPQEKMATARCRNRSNDLIYGERRWWWPLSSTEVKHYWSLTYTSLRLQGMDSEKFALILYVFFWVCGPGHHTLVSKRWYWNRSLYKLLRAVDLMTRHALRWVHVTAYRNAVSWQCGRDSWPRNVTKGGYAVTLRTCSVRCRYLAVASKECYGYGLSSSGCATRHVITVCSSHLLYIHDASGFRNKLGTPWCNVRRILLRHEARDESLERNSVSCQSLAMLRRYGTR